MTCETILTNARVVLPGRTLDGGVVVRDGRIEAVEPVRAGQDLDGDLLIPGLVELHTDHLEKHYSPRVGVVWDPVAAAMSHDAQCAASGITTVFDSLVIGAAPGWDMRDEWLRPMLDGLAAARSGGMLRADHRLHLRCEVTHERIVDHLERYLGDPGLGLISLMDHAPGDRQSPDIEAYKQRYRSTFAMDEAAVEAHCAALIDGSQRFAPANRQKLAAIGRAHGIAVASHDDARIEHVDEAATLGCVVSEFPTTLEAARAARAAGLHVMMGAPNLIRGGSHSGNVSATELAALGLLDVLSSDYIPSALLHAAFRLTEGEIGMALPDAVATVTVVPAAAVGLDDRGVIEPGRRGDLVRVRLIDGRPVVRGVWVQGRQVG